MFRKRKRQSLPCVRVLHKTWNYAFSRRSRRAVTAENVQNSVMHVQSCCFANLNLLLFCRSRFHRCRHCLSSLLSNHVRRKQPSGPIKSQSKNVCLLFFSLACDVIAFLFSAFYSFLGGQFMASNGWTLIPIYLTVSKFSYINRIILVKEHDRICYQWQTGWLKTSNLGKIIICKDADM